MELCIWVLSGLPGFIDGAGSFLDECSFLFLSNQPILRERVG